MAKKSALPQSAKDKAARNDVAQKKDARKRSPNSGLGPQQGAPTQHQDMKRRLGNFNGAGEHARVGGRTSGIVGQTKRRFKTDDAKRKS